MLEQKLKESILDRQVTHNMDVTVIIANPETVNELAYEIANTDKTYEEFLEYFTNQPPGSSSITFYMAIPIIRSSDIPKGTFLIK